MTTIRNGDAQARLRAHFQNEGDADALGDHIIALSGAHHVIEQDADGNWHVYRKGTRTADDRLSEGIDDPRPSQLREQLAKINSANQEFWSTRKGVPNE